MKYLLLLVLAVLPSSLAAADKHWMDARLVYVGNEVRRGGAVAVPIGDSLAAVPIRITFTYYKFETEDMTYVFATRNKKPLNLTLRGSAKIAMDSKHGYVLDDAGKQQKLEFVAKALK